MPVAFVTTANNISTTRKHTYEPKRAYPQTKSRLLVVICRGTFVKQRIIIFRYSLIVDLNSGLESW